MESRDGRVERRVGHRMSVAYYTERGTAADIETIVRLRSWIEDFVRSRYGNFLETKLITDYNAKSNIFFFKIVFFK